MRKHYNFSKMKRRSPKITPSKKTLKLIKEGYIAEAKEDRAICKEWESTLADGLDKELPLSKARAISLMWKKKLSGRNHSDSAKLIRKDRNR